MAAKLYIGFMRPAIPRSVALALVVAALAWPVAAGAQSFAADYSFRPALVAGERFNGAGLSVDAGHNWFAQVALGRSLQYSAILPNSTGDALSVGGGYRWADGQSLTMQVTSGRAGDRLGLSLSYDWPRYFVRLSYDSRFTVTPAETLRFSAGLRF
jgi:hypothetical protein